MRTSPRVGAWSWRFISLWMKGWLDGRQCLHDGASARQTVVGWTWLTEMGDVLPHSYVGDLAWDLLEILKLPMVRLEDSQSVPRFLARAQSQVGMGLMVSFPFDQGGPWIKSMPERTAADSRDGCISPHRAWLTGGRLSPTSPDLGGRESETITPPRAAQCLSDIGRGWASWPTRTFSCPVSVLKGITFRLV